MKEGNPIGPIADNPSGSMIDIQPGIRFGRVWNIATAAYASNGGSSGFADNTGLGVQNPDEPMLAVGLDGDGVAWFVSEKGSIPLSSWRFSKMKSSYERTQWVEASNTRVWLYGHKLPETSLTPGTSVITQMPTTGAPEGLSTVGVAAVGVGLLAVGIGLRRRDRV